VLHIREIFKSRHTFGPICVLGSPHLVAAHCEIMVNIFTLLLTFPHSPGLLLTVMLVFEAQLGAPRCSALDPLTGEPCSNPPLLHTQFCLEHAFDGYEPRVDNITLETASQLSLLGKGGLIYVSNSMLGSRGERCPWCCVPTPPACY
jgi:hypothetical protein